MTVKKLYLFQIFFYYCSFVYNYHKTNHKLSVWSLIIYTLSPKINKIVHWQYNQAHFHLSILIVDALHEAYSKKSFQARGAVMQNRTTLSVELKRSLGDNGPLALPDNKFPKQIRVCDPTQIAEAEAITIFKHHQYNSLQKPTPFQLAAIKPLTDESFNLVDNASLGNGSTGIDTAIYLPRVLFSVARFKAL